MKRTLISIFTLFALVLCLSACKPKMGENNTIRVGIHANEGGATLYAVADKIGYFTDEDLNVEVTIVESGPAEMTAMRADNRSLDAGYIGAGVSWNALDDSGNRLQFIYLDTLSISEMLIANPSRKPEINSSSTWQELYSALKGSRIAIPTDTTPGSWFKNFLSKVNKLGGSGDTEIPDAQKLWIDTETGAYVEGYISPNTNPDYAVEVVTESNENLVSVYSSYDFVCGFAPATTAVLDQGGVEVATTASHLPEYTFPSTWVASVAWMQENPNTVLKFVRALARASEYRANNMDDALRWAEELTQVNEGTYKSESMIAPSAHDLYSWFSDFDGLGYEYFLALYNDKKANVPSGNRVKSLPEALNVQIMLKAIADVINE